MPKKSTKKSVKSGASHGKKSEGFTAEERAAMHERVRELKASHGKKGKADGERDVLAKIAEMPEAERALAMRLHALIKASAPRLSPKTWYGMPAYANEDGRVVCFIKPGAKFKERYMTFGFNPEAKLDDGAMWPIAFAVTELTDAVEARIEKLVKRAMLGSD